MPVNSVEFFRKVPLAIYWGNFSSEKRCVPGKGLENFGFFSPKDFSL